MRDDRLRDGNLPLELDAFVGRSAELAALSLALESSRLVTLTGPGGIGKSRLAARAALRDGAWRVDLASVRDPEFVDFAVVEALGLTDHTARLPREILLAHLARPGRELLLVLDGFEHLVDVCAELVTDLLHRAPGLRVLAVGRRLLSVAGERVFALEPLTEAEAVELFVDRADRQGSVRRRRSRRTGLCRRLGGIPLAVELAAGRLRALPPVSCWSGSTTGSGC
ncbi:putative ATPase [Streptomyces canus]|nr:putative ATPase [Streptomyces canus]